MHEDNGQRNDLPGNVIEKGVRRLSDVDLPSWKCHKVVKAVKIKSIHYQESSDPEVPGHQPYIVPADSSISAFFVEMDFSIHKPLPGGYFVVYEDGYQSYSPPEAFENGYTLIEK